MLLTDELTDKQKTVLCLLAKDYNAQEIAEKMDVTEQTARDWMMGARNVLGVNTNTGAVAMAICAGLIE